MLKAERYIAYREPACLNTSEVGSPKPDRPNPAHTYPAHSDPAHSNPAHSDRRIPLKVDICILGAGIIGLSLALELRSRGRTVLVLEQHHAMSGASSATAGMLAAHDPENLPKLLELAELSSSMYPAFLDRIRHLSGLDVPIRTLRTLQARQPHHITPSARPLLSADALQHIAPALELKDSSVVAQYQWILLDEVSIDLHDLRAALPAAVIGDDVGML